MVGLGGMIGSMLRYAAVVYIRNQPFPYATFAVNIVGSFSIGAIAGLALRNAAFNNDWRLFLATGICGGFTTFSSFSLECLHLLQQNRYLAATFYIAASVILGISCALVGWILTK
jgi:CrcB protein